MKTATALVALFLLAWLSACIPVTPSTLSISPIATPNPVEAFVNANSSQATAVAAVSTAQFYAGQLTATVLINRPPRLQQSAATTNCRTERVWAIFTSVLFVGPRVIAHANFFKGFVAAVCLMGIKAPHGRPR